MKNISKFGVIALISSLLIGPAQSHAEGASVSTFKLPGDGFTPTLAQYLDLAKGKDAKEPAHHASATSKGDAGYGFSFALPPALLKPSVGISYQSGAMELGMPLNWAITGLMEIQRPLSKAYNGCRKKTDCAAAEWLLSGGISGTLAPSGNNDYWFILKSSQASYVTAYFDEAANRWTVYAGQTTATLEPADEGAEKSPDGTAVWRIAELKDSAGNYVTYTYDESHQLSSIRYGGNSATDEPHLIEVSFSYTKKTAPRTSAELGYLIRYENLLKQVTVKTLAKSTAPLDGTATAKSPAPTGSLTTEEARLYAYVFKYKVADNAVDLLSEIRREGKSKTTSETIANFSYTAFDDKNAKPRTAKAPETLGVMRSKAKSDKTSRSESLIDLQDFNRDGLPDLIDASGKDVASTQKWKVQTQGVEYQTRTFKWNETKAVSAINDTLSETQVEAEDFTQVYNKSHAVREFIDVDGDGYLDIVESGSADAWNISFGGGFKNKFKTVTVIPPSEDWVYSSENYNINTKHNDPDKSAEDDELNAFAANAVDLHFGFIDFNNDGWQDLYQPDQGAVWLHSGNRERGWDEKISVTPFEAIRSVVYTLEESSMTFEGIGEICPPEEQTATGTVGESRGNFDTSFSYSEHLETDKQTGKTNNVEVTTVTINRNNEGSDVITCWDAWNSTLKTKHVINTKESKGHYDLNGDGLSDYVDASDTTWRVYFNNGHGFEGGAAWKAPFPYTKGINEGTPTILTPDGNTIKGMDSQSYVYQTLTDVDGDGLLDLARTIDATDEDSDNWEIDRIWYKNTGNGFDTTTARKLPEWWADYFYASVSSSELKGDYQTGYHYNKTFSMMTDLDHDGMQDYVDKEDGIVYGPYPKPYLLKKIANPQGGKSEINYRSLATVSPSGNPKKEQFTPQVKSLVDNIRTADAVTGQSGETFFNYENGFFDKGIFYGFENHTLEQYINDGFTGKTEFTYELHRDFEPLITRQKNYIAGLTFGKTATSSKSCEILRSEIKNTYADPGHKLTVRLDAFETIASYGKSLWETLINKADAAPSSSAPPTADPGVLKEEYKSNYYLIKETEITEYGEKSGSKTVKHQYSWGDYGTLKTYKNDGGGITEDAVRADFKYVTDDATPYPHLVLMQQKTVIGYDPITGKTREISSEKFYYDNKSVDDKISKGFLTRSEAASGWVDGQEALDATSESLAYEYGNRGELIQSTDLSNNSFVRQSHGFGGAVVTQQTNTLGHVIVQELDYQGRVIAISDSNKMTVLTDYDDFSRVIKTTLIDTKGKMHTLTKTEFFTDYIPNYKKDTLYNDEFPEKTGYTVFDGQMRAIQSYVLNSNNEFMVSSNISDLRGLSLYTSHPENIGKKFTPPVLPLRVGTIFTQNVYDGIGDVRQSIQDKNKSELSTTVHKDNPWEIIVTDENGYQTRQSFDAQGRLRRVEQGKGSKFTTLATYWYDPLNRLVKFKDGEGTIYIYSYDGASRLRQVRLASASKTPPSTATAHTGLASSKTKSTTTAAFKSSKTSTETVWHTYSYSGSRLIKTTDADGLSSTWEFDAINRPVKTEVSDPLPGATRPLSYTFAYDSCGFIGALCEQNDPAGKTTFAYNELGRITATTREFTHKDGSIYAKFTTQQDLTGQTLTQTFPSGSVVNSSYSNGFLIRQTETLTGVPDYSLEYVYNKWGNIASVKSSLGHLYSTDNTTPLHSDSLRLTFGSQKYQRNYDWMENGLLKSKTDLEEQVKKSTLDSSNPLTTTALTKKTVSGKTSGSASSLISTSEKHVYAYDDFKELINHTLSSAKSSKSLESFEFNKAGNLIKMTDVTGQNWSYSLGDFNRITTRKSDKGVTQKYSYDQSGRISKFDDGKGKVTTYYYNGLGQLRATTVNGVWQSVHDYDLDNQLLRTGDSNPFESSVAPNYEFSYSNWRYDVKSGTTTELKGLVTTSLDAKKKVSREWNFKEFDGHTAVTLDDKGVEKSKRSLGVYGDSIANSGVPSKWETFHGAKQTDGLFHMGQRHLMRGDGVWLEPEPLLYQGIQKNLLADPLSVSSYRYGRNSPTKYKDLSGNVVVAQDQILHEYEARQASVGYFGPVPEEVKDYNERANVALANVTKAIDQYNKAFTPEEKESAIAEIVRNINPKGSNQNPSNNCNDIVLAAHLSIDWGIPAVAQPEGQPGYFASLPSFIPILGKGIFSGFWATDGDNVLELVRQLPKGSSYSIYSFTSISNEKHIQYGRNSLIDGTPQFLEGQTFMTNDSIIESSPSFAPGNNPTILITPF